MLSSFLGTTCHPVELLNTVSSNNTLEYSLGDWTGAAKPLFRLITPTVVKVKLVPHCQLPADTLCNLSDSRLAMPSDPVAQIVADPSLANL